MIESERYFAVDQEGNAEEINNEELREQMENVRELYDLLIERKRAEGEKRLSIGESFRIKPDGTLDDSAAPLGTVVKGLETEEDIYQFFREFIKAYPEFKVRFEKDPEGKAFRFEISKNEPK